MSLVRIYYKLSTENENDYELLAEVAETPTSGTFEGLVLNKTYNFKLTRVVEGVETDPVYATESTPDELDIFAPHYYSTGGMGDKWSISDDNYSPQAYYYKGINDRTYITWAKKGGPGFSREGGVLYFDHATRQYSATIAMGVLNEGATDSHLNPALIVADDGHLVTLQEIAHPGNIAVRRSANPEDPTGPWTQVATISIAPDGRSLAYPNIEKSHGMLLTYGRIGSSPGRQAGLAVSKDNGMTWSSNAFITIQDMYPDTETRDVRIYPIGVYTPENNGFHFVFNRRDVRAVAGGGSSYPECFYLYSPDGLTFYNAGKTWAKKAGNSNLITYAELKANCLIQSTVDAGNRKAKSVYVDRAHNIYLLIEHVDPTDNIATKTQYGYFEQGQWTFKDISVIVQGQANYDPASTNDRAGLIYPSSNSVQMFVKKYVPGNAYLQTALYRSMDKGDSWEFVRWMTIDENEAFIAGQVREMTMTQNMDNPPEGLFIAGFDEGNSLNDAVYFRPFNSFVKDYSGIAPTIGKSGFVTGTAFMASWTAVPQATNYLLDIATDSNFTSFVSGYQALSLASAYTTVTGLTQGTTYYYRVRAVVGGVTSPYSQTETASTTADLAYSTDLVFYGDVNSPNSSGAYMKNKRPDIQTPRFNGNGSVDWYDEANTRWWLPFTGNRFADGASIPMSQDELTLFFVFTPHSLDTVNGTRFLGNTDANQFGRFQFGADIVGGVSKFVWNVKESATVFTNITSAHTVTVGQKYLIELRASKSAGTFSMRINDEAPESKALPATLLSTAGNWRISRNSTTTYKGDMAVYGIAILSRHLSVEEAENWRNELKLL
jgi:hypothetical protein